MNKKFVNAVLLASLLVPASTWVFAETSGSGATTQPGTTVRERAAEKREELKEAIEARRTALEKTREEFKTKLESVREEFKTKLETKREEFKTRLVKIKDERKKEITERLYNRFNEINQKMTTHWGNALDRLTDALGKISSRADKAAAEGIDVTAVRTGITSAEASIVKARTAVTTQAGKVYTINVTDEANLKSEVAAVREALNKDMKVVKEVVEAARKSVVDVLRLLRGIPRIDDITSTSDDSN